MIGGLFKRRKTAQKTIEEPEVRRLYESVLVTVLTKNLVLAINKS